MWFWQYLSIKTYCTLLDKEKAELRKSMARQEQASNDNWEETCTMRWKLKKIEMHRRDRIAEKTSLNN